MSGRLPLDQTAKNHQCKHQKPHEKPVLIWPLIFLHPKKQAFNWNMNSKPSQAKHDFASFPYKKVIWSEINEVINDHPFARYCKSNVDLMANLWYEWLYEILQDFSPIETKHRVTLAPWVENESSHLIKKLNIMQNSYRTKIKPAIKTKVEETQKELTLSLQNDQFIYKKTVPRGQVLGGTEVPEINFKGKGDTIRNRFRTESNQDDSEKAELSIQYFQTVVSQKDYQT